jgi:hypothetical protein
LTLFTTPTWMCLAPFSRIRRPRLSVAGIVLHFPPLSQMVPIPLRVLETVRRLGRVALFRTGHARPIAPTGVHPDVLAAQRMASLAVSLVPLPRTTTAFLHHIAHVVGVRAEEEVVGAHAQRRIAMVAHLHPLGDGAVGEKPRETVCVPLSLIPANDPVPLPGGASLPKPTSLSLYDPRPKPTGFVCHTAIYNKTLDGFCYDTNNHGEVLRLRDTLSEAILKDVPKGERIR